MYIFVALFFLSFGFCFGVLFERFILSDINAKNSTASESSSPKESPKVEPLKF